MVYCPSPNVFIVSPILIPFQKTKWRKLLILVQQTPTPFLTRRKLSPSNWDGFWSGGGSGHHSGNQLRVLAKSPGLLLIETNRPARVIRSSRNTLSGRPGLARWWAVINKRAQPNDRDISAAWWAEMEGRPLRRHSWPPNEEDSLPLGLLSVLTYMESKLKLRGREPEKFLKHDGK